MKILVAGIGNLSLKDEGVGIHVIRTLEREPLSGNVTLLDGSTGGLHRVDWLNGYDCIILVDATPDNRPPGTVRLLRPKYASDYSPLINAHEIGLQDISEAPALAGDLPEVYLLAVSIADAQQAGTELTRKVAAAVPRIVKEIKRLVESLERRGGYPVNR
ncbi:MAG: hydrogenase maturation protease [Parabacteroides sp.]|nr:hydrogenase maturation protease [Parabacteroides sp.]